MGGSQKFIVDRPSIVSEPAFVIGPQKASRFVKAATPQNVTEGHLCAYRHPQPVSHSDERISINARSR